MTIKAMITEDDLLSRTMLSDLLEDHFPGVYIVGMAQTVKDSLEFIRYHQIDLLFLDLELPDGNGFEILESSESRDFGVIITTSHSTRVKEPKQHNLIALLEKPVTIDALWNAMKRYDQQLHIK